MKTIITAQAGLLQVKLPQSTPLRKIGARRKCITKFSQASRKRFLDAFAAMNITRHNKIAFLTLTYGEDYPGDIEAKEHLWALIARFKRAIPRFAAFWRLEPQERGAPHFHLIIFNWRYIAADRIAEAWRDIIGIERAANFDSPGYVFIEGEQSEYPDGMINDFPMVRIEMLKGKKQAMNYCAKYVAKVTAKDKDERSDYSFNDVAYLDAQAASAVDPKPTSGRFWGVIGKQYLPFAVVTAIPVNVSPSTYHRWVFSASMKYGNVGKSEDGTFKFKEQGFTLYVENAHKWLQYFMQVHIESWQPDSHPLPQTRLTNNMPSDQLTNSHLYANLTVSLC